MSDKHHEDMGMGIICERIIEMCERVQFVHSLAPGAKATWSLEMDGTTFNVEVSVARANAAEVDHV